MLLLIVGIGAWSGWFSSAPPDPPGPQAQRRRAERPPADRGAGVPRPRDRRERAERAGPGRQRVLCGLPRTRPSARWVRINIEPTTATALAVPAERRATRSSDPTRCPAPYHRGRAARGDRWSGRPGPSSSTPAATATAKRHGIWRALVVNGNAFHFYLTVPDARFAESKIIFDEMVRSFQFAT